MILRRGRVVEMGETAKVFDNPQHAYTRALIASVPHLHRKWTDFRNGRPEGDVAEDDGELVEIEADHLVRRTNRLERAA